MPLRRRLGLRRGRRHRPVHEVGRHGAGRDRPLRRCATGWGVNLSSNIKFGNDVLRLQAVYGEGIENYMNDAPADIGVKLNPGNPVSPIEGELLPMSRHVGVLRHRLEREGVERDRLLDARYRQLRRPVAERVQEGRLRAREHPVLSGQEPDVGLEVQWGQRENNSDGFSSDDLRFQFSAKYNFSKKLGGD